MKKWIISLLMLVVGLPVCGETNQALWTVAADTTRPALSRYEKSVRKWYRVWNKLIPSQFTLQYAGSIGAVSGGLGWHYGKKKQWETDLLVGYLPQADADESHFVFTAKQSYIPFHCDFGRRFELEPLTCGMFFSTISGEQFWKSQPSKYPKKYYGFSTAIRAHLFVGQRICYKIPSSARRYHKNISFYYELSTCDLYLVSKFTNSYLSVWDILSLALGVKLDLF